MMNLRILIGVISIFGLAVFILPVGVAMAEDSSFEATIAATGKVSDINGSRAKFHEYSDDNTGGVFGKVGASYDSPDYFLNFKATDPAYDTQHYRLDGGAYGKFKLWLDYNEIIHNITSDARSFYNGVGSNILSGNAGAGTNAWTAWPSVFDYSTKRKQINAGTSIGIVKPFFFDVNYFHEKKEGVRPVGSESTVALELPAVVDYTTNGLTVEAGYAKNPFFLSFSYMFSDFNDHSQDLFFTSQTGGVPGRGNAFSLPADSTMNRFAMKGSAMLPFNSKVNLNASSATTKSDTSSFPTFDGKVDTKNIDAAFTTNPLSFLDGKVFYKYYDRDNRSTGVVASGVEAGTAANRLSYRQNSYGADLGFKLPMKLHLNGGYKNVITNRRFNDEIDPFLAANEILPNNEDNIFSVDLRWSGLQFATFRVGYERLGRSADYRTVESQNVLIRNYAYSAQVRDTFKASVDLTPSDDINIGLEYNYKKANYHDTLYGLTGDKRNSVSFNADYAISKVIRLSGYFDAEKATLDQFATTSGTATQWASTLEEITYDYGFKADIAVIPSKLSLALSGDYTRSNGNNDLSFSGTTANFLTIFQLPAGGSNLPVDLPSVDSYQKYSAKLVASYNWSPSITIKAGYMYDRYKYSDSQLNGYQYILINNNATSSNAFLTGAYARPDYSVNTVFLGMIYRFK
jgi:MtrB/PioB family decaheme-associated outer membrane protein